MSDQRPAPGSRPVGKGPIAALAAAMIAGAIAVEGGWVNNRADPGGETNMGITKKVAVQEGYTGPMRTLPREVAESIYYRQYIVAPGYAPLITVDAAVTEELFDTTVNMGAPRPSRWFQQTINVLCDARLAEDGHVGPGTIAAFASCQTRVGATRLCLATLEQLDARQLAEYGRLVRVNPKLRVFYKGWVAHRVGNVDRRKCQARAEA
jgi:lysozyme family protein